MILNTFENLPEYKCVFLDPHQALKTPGWLRWSAVARSHYDSRASLIATGNVQSQSHFLCRNETGSQSPKAKFSLGLLWDAICTVRAFR